MEKGCSSQHISVDISRSKYHTYIHTCMHTYIHTYIHKYIHTDGERLLISAHQRRHFTFQIHSLPLRDTLTARTRLASLKTHRHRPSRFDTKKLHDRYPSASSSAFAGEPHAQFDQSSGRACTSCAAYIPWSKNCDGVHE
jgi:hypothetical protein